MMTNTAFDMYMGQHNEITKAAFEPARRRAVLQGQIADAQRPSDPFIRTIGRFRFAATAMRALTGSWRLARG